MNIKNRFFVFNFFIALYAWSSLCVAQNYPNRTTKIIVPFVAGGPTDVQARWAAQQLNMVLGQTYIVENRVGGGGVPGVESVVKSPADGYTLLAGNPGPLTVAPGVKANMPYQTSKDLAPIMLIARTASCLSVHPSVPANNVKEFVAYVNANPGKVNYGSPGVGTVGHLSIELFATQAGIKINHIPYKGAAQFQNDLIAGHIQLAQIQLANCIPLLKQGKIKTIGLTADKRNALAPEIPTIAEQGLPGFQSYNWNGLLAPAGTPSAIIDKLHSVLSKQLASKENQQLFISQGFEPSNFTPEEFANFILLETEKWAKIAKQADIKE
ncbi:tripartite tricarboxylate transporter substrate binding protein [Polynucleobacter sp. UK-Mo-2m-Kol15]|uniref:Bug family tripartite tricarboxylate transporter substrate binding protein n=1 Tax=Polynucleobacter sp. UK-Mo-2m-Kol15 TaxID=2576916 RepID=UPI001C0CEC39|nr:tripartite tricarboxylate transporter substrate binding protein [Polynucleobacter sp. UK-Mo-2m-Kol15]MBU3574879.1 tripartite tricarboxylate transporter substrate binding protein [Polynucleobacter sp. UK-Mo-2m-Kol15]